MIERREAVQLDRRSGAEREVHAEDLRAVRRVGEPHAQLLGVLSRFFKTLSIALKTLAADISPCSLAKFFAIFIVPRLFIAHYTIFTAFRVDFTADFCRVAYCPCEALTPFRQARKKPWRGHILKSGAK